MSDKKSKMPDFGEISSMAGKLFKDVKNSISEIIDEYKTKRAAEAEQSKPEKPAENTTTPHSESKPEDKQDINR